MKKIIAAVIIVLMNVVAVLSMVGCGSTGKSEFDQWVSDCIQADGIVALTSEDRYDCFIDNEIVILPGWEGY